MLILYCFILIVLHTGISVSSADVFSDHLPYLQIFKNAQRKVNSALQNELPSGIDLKSFSYVPEVDQTIFLKDAIDKLSTKSSNLSLTTAQQESSELCINHTMATLFSIASGEIWALRMFDAVDKLPSGILDGNTKFYGSYDECLKIESNIKDFNGSYLPQYEGQFCWASVPLKIQFIQLPLSIGICMPDSCNNEDTLAVLNTILPLIRIGNSPLYASQVSCKEKTPEFDTRAIALLTVCGFFVLLMVVGTLYDVIYVRWIKSNQRQEAEKILKNTMDLENSDLEKKPLLSNNSLVAEIFEPSTSEKLLLAFSVYSNGAKLLNTQTPPGTLTCINGIRFLSMSWVILGHTYVFGLGQASNINAFFPEMTSRWTFQPIINGLLSVDSFFALSGLLVSYLALKEMKKNNGRLNWGMFFFHRFWRLTPPYMLILGVYVSLNRYWSDGPMWNTQGMENNFCEDSWWKNLLYINNIVDNKNQCFGWSWYLANDMQFYILSPLMFVPLFFFKAIGIFVSLLFLLATFITTYVISADNKLGPGIFGGASESATDNYMSTYYFVPYCRIGPYVVGVITGYILYRVNGRHKLHWAVNSCGWIIAIVLGVTVTYGLHDALNNNPLSVEVAALYNATHRTVWGACVCWVIFACATGNGGYINTFLSWEGFSPLSRLTYCAYLVHPIVMYTYFQSLRKPMYFDDMFMISLFLTFLVGANMVAFVASLAFESPMMGLEKVIFGRGKKS